MEPTLNPESGFLRFRIDFSYDGSAFSGWARQPGQRTVQSELESALSGLTRSEVELTVAGRTDAGVHAIGQVAHFDIPEQDRRRRNDNPKVGGVELEAGWRRQFSCIGSCRCLLLFHGAKSSWRASSNW